MSDDGPGLAPESLGRVFEPFAVVQPGPGGEGLGLATVYGIVRQHGGFVTVESAFSQGTSFRVYLPWTEAELAGRKSRLSVDHPAAGHESILVVEDERSVARAIGRNLRRLGYDVWEADNGADALLELGEASSDATSRAHRRRDAANGGRRTLSSAARALSGTTRVVYEWLHRERTGRRWGSSRGGSVTAESRLRSIS